MQSRGLRIGSLCTGYGGLDHGAMAHYPGSELVWTSEIDPGCVKILAAHYPAVPNLGDLTTADFSAAGEIDLLCAGFPCQPFSTAGRRRGEDDERAIFEYIAERCIGVVRPRYILLENVPGILTLGGAGVLGLLASHGYDCRWTTVQASDVGAPHKRRRFFLLARHTDSVAGELPGSGDWRPGSLDWLGTGGTLRSDGRPATDTDITGGEARLDARHTSQLEDGSEPVGPSSPVGDADCHGRQVIRPGDGLGKACRTPGIPSECGDEPPHSDREGSQGFRREHQLSATSESSYPAWGPYEPAIRRWERILGRPAPNPRDSRGVRPEFVEWMMACEEDWVCGVLTSRTAALKCLGNGVVWPQVTLALSILDPA